MASGKATEGQNYLLLTGAWKSKENGEKENKKKEKECCRKGGEFRTVSKTFSSLLCTSKVSGSESLLLFLVLRAGQFLG